MFFLLFLLLHLYLCIIVPVPPLPVPCVRSSFHRAVILLLLLSSIGAWCALCCCCCCLLPLHPSKGQGWRHFRGHGSGRGRDDDLDSLPSDIDDRCESDISGVAPDSDDLSSSSGLDDLALSAGDVRRSYRHQTNSSLNAILSTLAIMALFSALGIGVGHFLGE